MDSRLHEAALTGSVVSLLSLLEEDPLLLERVAAAAPVAETPLHIAVLFGHLNFSNKLLRRKPELALEFDSLGRLPLHLASAKGHVKIVEELLKIDSGACFVRDKDGRTPLHIAAIKGRVEVLNEMVSCRQAATRVLTSRGETILHLCVSFNQFKALKLLVEWLDEDDSLVNFKDEDDNTILHLSAAQKQIQIMKYLLSNTRVEVNALNANNFTALDVLIQSSTTSDNIEEVKDIFLSAGAISGQYMSLPSDRILIDNPTVQFEMHQGDAQKNNHEWLNQKRDTLMVVAILIATETFGAGLNPPCGVWQDDSSSPFYNGTRTAENSIIGEAIMAHLYPRHYLYFTIFNLIGFLSSISMILLLISGFPIHQRRLMRVLLVIMWMAVSSMVVTYVHSFYALASDEILQHLGWVTLPMSLFGWLGLIALMFTGHFFRFVSRFLRKMGFLPGKGYKRSLTNEIHEDVQLRLGWSFRPCNV